jgi:bacterioferritin (cytochrome b1)
MTTSINPSGDFSEPQDERPIIGEASPDIADMGETIRQLNALLRGEIAATETYRNVLDKEAQGKGSQNIELLREIQEEHSRACQSLRDRIRELGGEPADSSGAWGVWAQAVQGTMSLFDGDAGGLKALREGEEHGLKDYRDAVDDVDPTSARLIQDQLIPAQERHVSLVKQLLNMQT